MRLSYKTRGNSTPQGKPRVYFAAHPEDYGTYLEEIVRDILKTQDCTVYYDEEPWKNAAEADLRQLKQMQLFVFPVTSRFLYQKNRALDIEFPFATKYHIPILPLVQEAGLEEVFDQVCGELQMLSKYGPDPTALPYAEKLEKFLESKLVGDTLARKIRSAFDAYVFLSYRKKDREYAQELMRLIHKNEFCRDIAIWYDEFLTPGENFNSAISSALKNCKLFTLAVTPNILAPNIQGDPNFVVAYEYPDALKRGKLILPIELVATDQEALRQSFQDIPPCTNAYDEQALRRTLQDAVQKLAIPKNDSSPEHKFLIGLAYLNGIDVEVDRTRALELITGAAEAGLPEAAKQLVAMYRAGNGVPLDFQKAVAWQRRLAAILQAIYEDAPSKEAAAQWNMAIRDLGEFYQELGDFEAAKDAYSQSLKLCQSQLAADGGKETLRALSASLDLMGNLFIENGDYVEAPTYYRRGFEIDRQLCAQKEAMGLLSAEDIRNLSIDYNHFGELAIKNKAWDSAEDLFRQSLPFSQRYHQLVADSESLSDLATTLEGLARAIFRDGSGDVAQAQEIFQQVVALRQSAYEQEESPYALVALAVSNFNFAITGNGPSELKALELSYNICLQLQKDYPDVVEYRTRGDLAYEGICFKIQKQLAKAIQYIELGQDAMSAGQPEKALGYFRQAEADGEPFLLWKSYAEEPILVHLAEIRQNAARAELALQHFDRALEYCRKAREILHDIVRVSDTLISGISLIRIYNTEGDIYLNARYPQEARDCYKKAGSLCIAFYQETKDLDAYALMAQTMFNHAAVAEMMSKPEEVRQMVRLSESVWSDLAELYPDNDEFFQQQDWTREHMGSCLSDKEKEVLMVLRETSHRRRQTEELIAQGAVRNAIDNLQDIIAKLYNIGEIQSGESQWLYKKRGDAYRGVCTCYERLGDIFDGRGQPDQASISYNYALDIRKVLAKSKEPEDLEALVCTCIRISGKSQEVGSQQLLETARGILTALCQQFPKSQRYAQELKDLP